MQQHQVLQKNGVSGLEIIRGNMLTILTMISGILFLVAWSHYYEGPFRMVFIYSRKKNIRYEYRMMGIFVVGISVGCICVYQLICKAMNYQAVSVINMVVPFFALFTTYLLTNMAVTRKNVAPLAMLLMIWLCGPIVLMLCMGMYHVRFDSCCGYVLVVLALLDVLLVRKSLSYWKKGDL